jgi:integrase/recombinase XerD
MPRHNAENERIKRAYFVHLKLAAGLSEASIDATSKAIHRFESLTGFRSFKKLHIEQVIAFRRHLDEALGVRSGKPLSKATILQTLNILRAFVLWLAEQPGYRRRIRYSDAEYFRLSEKDTRIAKARMERRIPTPEQVERVLEAMPTNTDTEKRNRALIAFTWLTGIRDGALASLKVKHVDLSKGRVDQDPREVKTKNSKAQMTTFFPVGGGALQIVTEWVNFLTKDRLWGLDDPLFPATLIRQDADHHFTAGGLARRHWSDAGSIRKIFREAFEASGLPSFNPHSFRHALAMLGEQICRTAEELKAWSQNLSHADVLTTLSSYGKVAPHRQAEILKALAAPRVETAELQDIALRLAEIVRRGSHEGGSVL